MRKRQIISIKYTVTLKKLKRIKKIGVNLYEGKNITFFRKFMACVYWRVQSFLG